MSSFTRQVARTDKAPAYPSLSQATIYNGIVFLSGSLGTDPKTMQLVEGTIADRTTQALKNLEQIAVAAGSSREKFLRVTIFITKISDQPKMNEAYLAFFPQEPRPARACIAVAELGRGTDVEIMAEAAI